MDLDESLRASLRRAADAEDSGASPDVALAQRVARDGPGLVRATRRRQQVTRVLVAGGVLTVPIALFALRGVPTADTVATTPVAAASCPVAALASGPLRSVELPALSVTAAPDASGTLAISAPCVLDVTLAAGDVGLDARAGHGATIVVHTPERTAIFRGTAFEVAASVEEITVVAVRGGTIVLVPDGREVELGAGERWTSAAASTTPSSGTAAVDPTARLEPTTPAGPAAHLEPARASGSSVPSILTGVPSPASEVAARPGDVAPARGRDEPDTSLEALVREAEAARRAGDLATARALYERVGAGGGPVSEAAWIRLARLELEASRPGDAARALQARRRFGRGVFGAEAAWLDVEIRESQGDGDGASRAARALVDDYPDTPQADAAREWLAR